MNIKIVHQYSRPTHKFIVTYFQELFYLKSNASVKNFTEQLFDTNKDTHISVTENSILGSDKARKMTGTNSNNAKTEDIILIHNQDFLTNILILEDFWVASVRVFSSELPYIKEWLPVDIVCNSTNVIIFEHSCSKISGAN